jgi:hypothetical protein
MAQVRLAADGDDARFEARTRVALQAQLVEQLGQTRALDEEVERALSEVRSTRPRARSSATWAFSLERYRPSTRRILWYVGVTDTVVITVAAVVVDENATICRGSSVRRPDTCPATICRARDR